MKLDTIAWALGGDRSLPARGVWIEIRVRILARVPTSRHSPQGECGLKSITIEIEGTFEMSLPARGVWIEITMQESHISMAGVTPRKGSVD